MFTCDKTVVKFSVQLGCSRAVTGGSACWGNGSVLRSLRLGNSALCICFHSQLCDFRCKKFPEKSLLCRFLWEFLLFIILSATNLLQYVPVPVRLCFLHDRLPVNRISIYLLFCSLLTYSALIFLADEILQTVSY